MMTNQKIKIAIAGFGRIVEFVHLSLIKAVGQFEVDGIYDVTEKRCQIAANQGHKIYQSYEELLTGESDLVLIATPPNFHYEMVKAALNHRKNVLVEKPISLHYKEAEEVVNLAKSVDKTVQVFYNRRFNPDYRFIGEMIRSEVLGPILFVERRQHSQDAGISFGVKSFDPEWRVKSQYGGGALFDWGIHLIDQLTCLNLGNINKINSFMYKLPHPLGETEDYIQANMELDNQMLLSFEVNFRSNANVPLWLVGGEKQTLMINANYEALLYEKGKVIQTYALEKESRKNGLEIYQSFVDVLGNNEPPVIRGDEILLDMKVLESIKRGSQHLMK
jgi:scyllo-inositol 2-dehydrogenase (NADP+)